MDNQTDQFSGVRWMVRRDMPEVLAIEMRSFEHPWSEEEFLRVLRDRRCIGMVCERQNRIAGHMIYELHRDRIVVLNFATHPEFRRKRIGESMTLKLKSKLNANRRRRLTLIARESNVSGLNFWKAQGFLATNVDRGHFSDSGEDGISMIFEIPMESLCRNASAVPENRVLRYMS